MTRLATWRWFRALPLREQVPLALMAMALLLGVTARPVAALVSTDFALFLACPLRDLPRADTDEPGAFSLERDVVNEELVDVWGRPWRFDTRAAFGDVLYSVGPDGQDDAGRGDDVRMLNVPGFTELAASPWLGAAAAMVALWGWAVVRALAARRSPALPLEGWRALVVVSPLIPAAAYVVLANARELEGVVDARRLLVSPPTAVAGTIALLLWLGALRVRLGRPTEEPDAPVGWRAPALLTGVVLMIASGLLRWSWEEARAVERRRVLAAACLAKPDSVLELVITGDLELIRAFARRDPPRVPFLELSEPALRVLGRAGADAVPLMIRALRQGSRQVAWRHLRTFDPRLDALFAAVKQDPLYGYRSALSRELFLSRTGVDPWRPYESSGDAQPRSWLVLDVHRPGWNLDLTVDGDWVNIAARSNTGEWLHAVAPRSPERVRRWTVKVHDAVSGRTVEVPYVPRRNETTWAVIDMEQGTCTTHLYVVPP